MAKEIKTRVRTEGTENKTTKEIRNVLKEVINNEFLNIETLLNELPPKERLEVVTKLIPYVLPKVNNVQYRLGEPLFWD
jgi:actin-like ATPase involved in cell morphogenesis